MCKRLEREMEKREREREREMSGKMSSYFEEPNSITSERGRFVRSKMSEVGVLEMSSISCPGLSPLEPSHKSETW